MKIKKFSLKKAILLLVLLGALCYGGLFALVQWGERDTIVGDPQTMIVLGCKVMPWGAPSVLLQDRLNEAFDYWSENPEMTIVVSGGQGPDEPVTEAQCMADYLIDLGVPAEQILLEDQSHNTNQNIRYSLQLLQDSGFDGTADMMVVSNGFHLTRARMLWGRAVGTTENLSTLAAPCSHQPSKISMDIREPLALVKSFVFDHNIELGEPNA